MIALNHCLKIIFFLFVIFANQTGISQELIKTIPIEGKNLTNLSGPMNDSISFHIIINKVDGDFNSRVHFFNREKELNSLEIYKDTHKPSYLCFHVNGSTLTLIRETEDEKILIQDVDYISGQTASKKINFEPRQIFSHSNITFVSGGRFNQSYPIAFIKNTEESEFKLYTPKNKTEREFLSNLSKKAEFVNDLQFLNNGPIMEYKGFYNGGELLFIHDNKKEGLTNIIVVNPTGLVSDKIVPVRNKNSLKRLSSFVKDSLLFTFRMYKEAAYLDIHELESLERLNTFHYTKPYFGAYNRIVQRGKDITDSFSPKKVFSDFTPQAVGSMYLPALNIAVNKTVNNEYVIRIGHLNKNNYNNTSTYNYWWNNDAYILNYDLNSGKLSGNAAAASGAFAMMMFQAMADAKDTGNYFELFLNQSLEQTNSIENYQFYDIDKNVYDAELEEKMTLKNQFYILQKENIRLINFDKASNTYNIYNMSKSNP